KKEEADLRRDLEPQARRRLERALALGQVVEDEQLAVEEAEIDGALARLIEPLTDSADAVRRALDTPAGRQRLRLDLLTDKAVARLVQIARGEDPAKGSTEPPLPTEPPTAAEGETQG
ncbi:MAG TPA: hypothetical protein VK449_04260, partial [Anaerolineales bacterium]|nr:hypothetical protein [Anaerolineales bacterium]